MLECVGGRPSNISPEATPPVRDVLSFDDTTSLGTRGCQRESRNCYAQQGAKKPPPSPGTRIAACHRSTGQGSATAAFWQNQRVDSLLPPQTPLCLQGRPGEVLGTRIRHAQYFAGPSLKAEFSILVLILWRTKRAVVAHRCTNRSRFVEQGGARVGSHI